MTSADNPIRIRIKEEGSLRFPPGELIEGLVEIFPETMMRCRAVDISVLWYTEGKGRRDEGIVQSWHYDVEQIGPGQSFSEGFSATLPSAPWSYAGHFINIVWVIHVKIDIPMSADMNREARFLVLPMDLPV